MPSLIESILSIEAKAGDIVANAHAEASAIAKKAEDDIKAAGAALAAETAARLAALEDETNDRLRHEETLVQSEYEAARAAIEKVADRAIQDYAAKIVAAFLRG